MFRNRSVNRFTINVKNSFRISEIWEELNSNGMLVGVADRGGDSGDSGGGDGGDGGVGHLLVTVSFA